MNEVIYSVGMTLEDLERMVIQKAMNHFRGNKMTTAASLGIDRRTLDHRLIKYADEQKLEQERKDDAERRRAEQLARARGNPPNNLGIPYNGYQTTPQRTEVYDSGQGLRMEPAINFTPKQAMPLSKRVEVQEVLLNETTKNGKKK